MEELNSNFCYNREDILNRLPVTRINSFNLNSNEMSHFLSTNPGLNHNELNTLFHRSDNFKKEHEGAHVIFCGDSYTFGTGLLEDEIWSKKLYKKLSEEIKLSGYFNLSHPGIPISSLIFDMFRYFKEYGNPDIIFLNLTTPYRLFRMNDEKDGGHKNIPIANSLSEMISYQYYYMLEIYCLSNKIELYTFSWRTNHLFSKISALTRYYKFTDDDFHNWSIKNKPKEKNDFLQVARDGQHPGTLMHDFFVDFIYGKYKYDNFRN